LDVVDAVVPKIARLLAEDGLFVATDCAYQPRNPEATLLYQVVAEQLETFLARQEERDRPVPKFVEKCVCSACRQEGSAQLKAASRHQRMVIQNYRGAGILGLYFVGEVIDV